MGRTAVILRVNPYDLHGVTYYQIYIEYEDAPGRAQEVRLPNEQVYPNPAEGDRVEVEALLSMVTGLRKVEATSS